MATTKLANQIDPQVMADMITAKLPKAIKFSPFATIDTTLEGRPGSTITVPKFAYIGDAADVAEGEAIDTSVLTASTTQATVKKAGKAVELTDEAVLSGYGDPLGEASRQLALSLAAKIDNDCFTALSGATLTSEITGSITYDAIVDACDKFAEEGDSAAEKVIFVHPHQVTELRKDENFISRDKYGNQVMVDGEIGMIAGCRVVKSAKTVDASGNYINPIMIISGADNNTVDETPALTIYLKRGVALESDRDILKKTTVLSADEHYVATLSNEAKVVVLTCKVSA